MQRVMRYAVYIHDRGTTTPHLVIHANGCGEIQKRGVGDVTPSGFWVWCESLEAAERLFSALQRGGFQGGTSKGDPYHGCV